MNPEDIEGMQEQRRNMVARQIAARGITDPRLLEVMGTVPRHLFVPPAERSAAYADAPLSIGQGQTISQPYIVALMTDLLQLKGDERVLDVGTGSGYQAAVLGKMAAEVHTIEVIPVLAMDARDTLSGLGYANIYVHIGDGSLGWPEAAPFAGIVVAAAAPSVPEPLLSQLAEGGRLVLPVGSPGFQHLEVWTCKGRQYEREVNLAVAFVPLRGKLGWK
jgi:protein-L-isoaspartate(D-aspartate) O-methyltransferase